MLKSLIIFFILLFLGIYSLRFFKNPTSDFVCYAAGKSGGHIIPALTLAEKNKNSKILFFSTEDKLDQDILKKYNFIDKHISLKLDKTPHRIWDLPKFIWQFTGAFFKSLKYLFEISPQKVITTGGYLAVPVSLAAWILDIPIELYELNAVPGKAVRYLAWFATKINICFPQAKKYFNENKVNLVDYPIRFKEIKQEKSNQNTILILGGSQGSQYINNLMIKAITLQPNIFKDKLVIHQAGAGQNVKELAEIYKKNKIDAEVFEYLHELDKFYGKANLVIARAGAGTIFELLFFKKPSILIPLEGEAESHQLSNALAIEELHPEIFKAVRQQDIDENLSNFLNLIK